MKVLHSLILLSHSLLLAFSVSTVQADNIDLFILAGQSNMQGWRSDAAQYPKDTQKLDKRIPFYFEAINYGSSGQAWMTLDSQIGHFSTGHFGPEVLFARSLLKSRMKPAIFKYSIGGSSLKTKWKAPGAKGLYDDMVTSLRTAINELKAQGHTVTPRAFVWIQGESDADNQQLATEYYWHLRKMLHHFRTNVMRDPLLPVILSVDEQHPRVQQNPQVVEAQIKLAAEGENIAFMSMYGLEKYDVTHLTAKGTIEQGKQLFTTYQQIQR
ncbi:MAG: sialate O-acetylesterase [Cocleimonas sp.]